MTDGANEDVSIVETARAVKNTGRRGIAGTNPLVDWSARVNEKVLEGVRNMWDSFNPDPPADEMVLGSTWFTQTKDVEIHFRNNGTPKLMSEFSTDHRYQRYRTFVDAHIFVQGAGPDVEPPRLSLTENGLDNLISLNETTLIPNAECVVTHLQPASDEVADDLQVLWHSIVTIQVSYWKVRVD